MDRVVEKGWEFRETEKRVKLQERMAEERWVYKCEGMVGRPVEAR